MTETLAASERFRRLVEGPEEAIGLARGALLIAAEEHPELDVEARLRQLDDLGDALKRRLRPDIGTTDSILALNRYLFEELGFRGAGDSYYDPRNSFLDEVLDRRIGIPITLSIVYIEVGRRIGLAFEGVSFPGHFLVRCPVRDGTVVLDPYHKGASLGLDDLQRRLAALKGGEAPERAAVAAMLAPAGTREILARVLRNLRGIYLHFKQLPQALAASSRILMLEPDEGTEWRDRGLLHLELECFRAALGDLQRYLALVPDAEDADAMRARVVELQHAAARLN